MGRLQENWPVALRFYLNITAPAVLNLTSQGSQSILGLKRKPAIAAECHWAMTVTPVTCHSDPMFSLQQGCGGLNRKGPYRLIDLNVWSPWSGTFRRYGLAVVCEVLLEEVCHWG